MSDATSIEQSSAATEGVRSRATRGVMAADSALAELIRILGSTERAVSPRRFVFENEALVEVMRDRFELPWAVIAELLRKQGSRVDGKRLASYLSSAKRARQTIEDDTKRQSAADRHARETARFAGLIEASRGERQPGVSTLSHPRPAMSPPPSIALHSRPAPAPEAAVAVPITSPASPAPLSGIAPNVAAVPHPPAAPPASAPIMRLDPARQGSVPRAGAFPSTEEEFDLLRAAVLQQLGAGVVDSGVTIVLPDGSTKPKQIPVTVQRMIEDGHITTLAQFVNQAKPRN